MSSGGNRPDWSTRMKDLIYARFKLDQTFLNRDFYNPI
jgi:hypothetical protein